MAIYYAIVKDKHIQQDIDTGQLEIYGSWEEAEVERPRNGAKVIEVEVFEKLRGY